MLARLGVLGARSELGRPRLSPVRADHWPSSRHFAAKRP
jgi:hypothetical protein